MNFGKMRIKLRSWNYMQKYKKIDVFHFSYQNQIWPTFNSFYLMKKRI